MAELWDGYDRELERIEGMVLVRDEAIPAGVYHLVCDVIVRHVDGSYLLMRRDLGKHHGGMWELTAGGSALQGEGPLECGKRELMEETGIVAGELEELGRVVCEENGTFYVEFLCVTDWRKDGVVLQEGETIDYRWVERDVLLGMRYGELATERTLRFVRE